MPAPPPPAPPPPPPPAPRRREVSRPVLFAALAVVVIAGGLAAVLLLGGGGSSTKTVTVAGPHRGAEGTSTSSEEGQATEAAEAEEPPAAAPDSPPGTLTAGRYAQAGTFKFVADAEEEQRRLAGDGIQVRVVASEEAQQLYPGFQVLLGGPLRSTGAEKSLLKRLRHDGVPSAFVRPLRAARASSPSELGGGTWSGKLEESSTSRPRLDRSLRATLTVSADGGRANLALADLHCVDRLRGEPPTGPSLRYETDSGCLGGTWRVRPAAGGLMLSLLPAASDLIVLGELHSD